MLIGGLQKFSVLDYPGCLSAVIFTQGCNFRCQYCYNPMLVWPAVGKYKNSPFSPREKDEKGHPGLSEDDLFLFLESRIGKLDAVVITGGEPTLHGDLPGFAAKIKESGFKVKLDTNGSNPAMLRRLIRDGLVDYLAMDIKAPPSKYKFVCGAEPDLADLGKSVMIVKESGLPHEFRTTVVPALTDPEDIEEIGKLIAGAEKWFLQRFKSDNDLINERLKGMAPVGEKTFEKMRQLGAKYAKECRIR